MSTLYVRNFPDDLHSKVRTLAAQRKRSLGAEVIVLVEEGIKNEATRERRLQALDGIGRSRESLPRSSNSLELLREDRNR